MVAGSKGGRWLSYVTPGLLPHGTCMSCIPPSHDTAKAQIPIVMVNRSRKYNSEFIHTQKQLLPRYQGAGPVLTTANYASDLWEKILAGMF